MMERPEVEWSRLKERAIAGSTGGSPRGRERLRSLRLAVVGIARDICIILRTMLDLIWLSGNRVCRKEREVEV